MKDEVRRKSFHASKMQLLLCPMNLILLVVVAIATPPPSHVRPPNEDKDPPRYRYEYEIGNVDGNEGQGKTEARSGDLASGRYYVNGEKSSTDVKYYADEWGYHPLVKYHAADEHSSATTHFALGEHVVKSLLNGSEVNEEVKLPPLKGRQNQLNRQPSRRRHPVQLIQPYTPLSSGITATSIDSVLSTTVEKQTIDDTSDVHSPPNYDNKNTSARSSGIHDRVLSTSSYQQNFNNYVTLPRTTSESIEESERSVNNERDYSNQQNYPVAFTGTTSISDYRVFARPNIYQRHQSTSGSSSSTKVNYNEGRTSSREDLNDLFPTVSDDFLHVENAGSFGRRLKPSTNRSPVKSNIQQKFTTSIPRSNELLTPKPFVHIPATADKIVSEGTSSYTAYSMSTTTPRMTSATYSKSIRHNVEPSIITLTSDLHDSPNSVGSEVSSKDLKNRINDVRRRDNTISATYASIYAKIHPNGERTNEIGENVNSLVASNFKPLHYESNENDTKSNERKENTGKTGSLDYDERSDHDHVRLRQSLDTDTSDSLNAQSSILPPSSTYSSKPIVVAELSNYKTDKVVEHNTTFPCNNEKLRTAVTTISNTFPPSFRDDSDVLLVTPKLQISHNHITTSSVILNPIQAGVSLVNADQTELIGTENQIGGIPAPVIENIEGDSQVVAIKTFSTRHGNELGETVTEETGSQFYETINPAFGQSMLSIGAFDKSLEITRSQGNSLRDTSLPTENAKDKQIVIQKSVEIHQNAPMHEIHYPPEAITPVTDMNRFHAEDIKQQQLDIIESLHQRSATKEAQEMRSIYAKPPTLENVKQFDSPLQNYNGEDQIIDESNSTHILLESIRDVSLSGGSAYHDNLFSQHNESVDYPIERNKGVLPVLSKQDDIPRITKWTMDGVPEVKYTTAQMPRISVKEYPPVGQTNDSRQTNEWQQEVVKEQHEQVKFNAAKQGKKLQSQLQKILSESESIQHYLSDADWLKLEAQEQRQKQQQSQPEGSQERSGSYQVYEQHEQSHQSDGSYQVQETIDEPRVRQSSQQQSIIVPWAHLYNAPTVKDLPGNFSNALKDVSTESQLLQENHTVASTGERMAEKTVYVPHPYPVEVSRLIEKKMPYPVEKIIEKKIPVPQPYPVHIQVPVDRVVEKQVQILQPYPVHVEKIIEKKVPYPVQRLVPQPYPVHIFQPYAVEKIIEKPVHIPITVEKIVEKRVHVPQPYPVQVPIKVPYPVEITKYVGNMVQVPYGVRYGVSYQQIMKPESSKGLYGSQGSMSVPLYGLSLVSHSNRERERPNVSQDFKGYGYDKPVQPFISGGVELTDADQRTSNGWEQFSDGKSSSSLENNNHHQAFAKKSYHSYVSKLPSLTYPLRNYSGTNRWHGSYRQSAGPVSEQSITKNEYVGPVPLLKQNPQHQVMRTRSSAYQQQPTALKQQHSTAVTRSPSSATVPTSSRRARQPDDSSQCKKCSGTFRQSKMEYGFKPPMVPSVQYDENTAAKVEN